MWLGRRTSRSLLWRRWRAPAAEIQRRLQTADRPQFLLRVLTCRSDLPNSYCRASNGCRQSMPGWPRHSKVVRFEFRFIVSVSRRFSSLRALGEKEVQTYLGAAVEGI